MPSSDLVAQAFATNGGSQSVKPSTIPAGATIAPVSLITYVTGTTQVATITPPLEGPHMLVLVFTNSAPGTMLTTGNITTAIVPTEALPTFMFYNPLTRTYFGGTLNLT